LLFGDILSPTHDYFFFFDGVWLNADPAAVLDALPVLPLRKTLLAAEAAFGLVCLLFFKIASKLF
jgi:hypothetical protein